MTRDQAGDESPGRMGGTPERPARFFDTPEEFGAWLALHHDSATHLLDGPEEEARRRSRPDVGAGGAEPLSWGWMDSVARRIDDDTRRQRWTPRKKTSH